MLFFILDTILCADAFAILVLRDMMRGSNALKDEGCGVVGGSDACLGENNGGCGVIRGSDACLENGLVDATLRKFDIWVRLTYNVCG
jgi:hypothetical protein